MYDEKIRFDQHKRYFSVGQLNNCCHNIQFVPFIFTWFHQGMITFVQYYKKYKVFLSCGFVLFVITSFMVFFEVLCT